MVDCVFQKNLTLICFPIFPSVAGNICYSGMILLLLNMSIVQVDLDSYLLFSLSRFVFMGHPTCQHHSKNKEFLFKK